MNLQVLDSAIIVGITRYTMINSITIIGIIGLFLATNFIWYWQGFKDGRREGYARGRNLSRQGFWQE